MKLIKRILTERLVIRPFEMRDWALYLEFMTDPAATRYLMFTDEQRTEAGARELFEMILRSYGTAEPIMAYAIARREGGSFVGSCGVSPLDEPGVYECYYSLLPRYWKRGYATEATRALLARCLAEEGVREIRA
jgi:RimJ/RimL family protein N-acetyltransferase